MLPRYSPLSFSSLPATSVFSPRTASHPRIFTPLRSQRDSAVYLALWQVARTITNMQQQIQQHQRQLYQALLMKQQQLPSHSSSSSSSSSASSSSSTGLHPPGGPGKSTLDPFTGPHQAPGLVDTLHTKEPPSSPNTYSTYPLCESSPQLLAQ